MKSRRTRHFHDMYGSLPPHIQEQAVKAFHLFESDPSHPSLHFKPVHSNPLVYSIRIGILYRALAYKRDDAWLWFWIGPHSQYDKLLGSL